MEQKKAQFGDIKGILSRDEMKKIKGGSGGTQPKPCVLPLTNVGACAWNGLRAERTGPGMFDWRCCI